MDTIPSQQGHERKRGGKGEKGGEKMERPDRLDIGLSLLFLPHLFAKIDNPKNTPANHFKIEAEFFRFQFSLNGFLFDINIFYLGLRVVLENNQCVIVDIFYVFFFWQKK